MIVRCVQIISPTAGTVVEDHPAIRVGREYPVLEVLAGSGRVLFRILDEVVRPDEYDSPGLWDAAMFVVGASGCRLAG
jgi:hypothetical protein